MLYDFFFSIVDLKDNRKYDISYCGLTDKQFDIVVSGYLSNFSVISIVRFESWLI